MMSNELTPKDKKRIIREIFEQGWNRQQFDSFSAHLAENIIFNFRGMRQKTNLEDLKSLVAFWKGAFPDLQFMILNLLTENDIVAVNLLFTGTHEGVWRDLAPTGRRVQVEEMMFFRFENGKLVELWEVYDEAGMRRQILDSS